MDQFNTDTSALRSRANINARGAKHDLEEWIIRLLPPLRGLQVLDLGCGTGKQVFQLAPLVTDEGQILGVDIAEDAVRAVNQRAEAEGVSFVEAQQINLDDCLHHLADKHFDLIVSGYAIYYAQDAVALLKGLRSLLKDQGVVFICGPGRCTNYEMQAIINRFVHSAIKPIDDFLGPNEIRDIAATFSQFSISRLENQIVFDSADAVLAWWKNHNSFDHSVAAPVEEFVRAYFVDSNTFALTKNVLGVRFDV